MKRSLPTLYFDKLYADNSDPWDFETSSYERDKYAATLAALQSTRYKRALEVGCSIGIFTEQLASHCDELVALEPAITALDQARRRCAGLDIDFRPLSVPDEWPEGVFDLIVLSEVLYYLDRNSLGRLARRLKESAMSKCDVLLVHYIGDTDYPLTGDEAVETLVCAVDPFCSLVTQARKSHYRLDLLRRS